MARNCSDSTLTKRFWSKVTKGSANECWLWIGHRDRLFGYGRIGGHGTVLLAHRASWILHHGEVPRGLCVLHRCDTPACVNPAHLFLGTYLDNNRDRAAKNRSANTQGERNPFARLDEERVRSIRKLHNAGHKSAALARKFNVSISTISLIVRGRTWRHVA